MFKFLGDSVKKVFGTKYDKDVKQYTPFVEEINEYFVEYRSLSNDDLRNKTHDFRNKINTHLEGINADISQLDKEAMAEPDFDVKEQLFKEMDELKKEKDKHLEEILKEILAEAFAVVKETSRRFTENSTIEVSATQFDRDLAAEHSFVQINGDKAIWSNTWLAAGGEITWNMIHYDVQLIGGMVLHDGKIAEMQTGEGKP